MTKETIVKYKEYNIGFMLIMTMTLSIAFFGVALGLCITQSKNLIIIPLGLVGTVFYFLAWHFAR